MSDNLPSCSKMNPPRARKRPSPASPILPSQVGTLENGMRPKISNQTYEFETPQTDEAWFQAFSRRNTSITPYRELMGLVGIQPPVLPYEMEAATSVPNATRAGEEGTRKSKRLTIRNKKLKKTVPLQNPINVAVPPSHGLIRDKPSVVPSFTQSMTNPFTTEPKIDPRQYIFDAINYIHDPYLVTLLKGQDPDAEKTEVPSSTKETTMETDASDPSTAESSSSSSDTNDKAKSKHKNGARNQSYKSWEETPLFSSDNQ